MLPAAPVQLASPPPPLTALAAAALSASPHAAMALIEMGKPRPGEGVPLKEVKMPGAAMAVLAICPGSDASAALVCWTNPGGRFQSLDPAAMEIRLLVKLPTDAQPGGAGRQVGPPAGNAWIQPQHRCAVSGFARLKNATRPLLVAVNLQSLTTARHSLLSSLFLSVTRRQLDVPAARELLHAALATLPPGCKTYAYLLDSRQGADYSGDPGVKARVQANFEQASQLLRGLPLTHSGHVNSNARSRCLKLGKNKKTLATMHTALAVFPQAQGRMRCVLDGLTKFVNCGLCCMFQLLPVSVITMASHAWPLCCSACSKRESNTTAIMSQQALLLTCPSLANTATAGSHLIVASSTSVSNALHCCPACRTAKHDWPLASALLVVAHVVGATAHPVPQGPTAAARQAAVAAPAVAGPPRRAAGAGAAAPPAAGATTGSRGGRAAVAPAPAAGAAAQAAATGGAQAAPLAAVKEEPQAAAVKEEPLATAVKEEPQTAPAGAAPAVATPSQRAPKQPMRGAGAGGRSRKRVAAVGAIDLTGAD